MERLSESTLGAGLFVRALVAVGDSRRTLGTLLTVINKERILAGLALAFADTGYTVGDCSSACNAFVVIKHCIISALAAGVHPSLFHSARVATCDF